MSDDDSRALRVGDKSKAQYKKKVAGQTYYLGPDDVKYTTYSEEAADPDDVVKQMGNKTKAGMRQQAEAAGGFKKSDRKIQGSFKKGGRVRKTGIYKLHKGEKVVPVKKVGRKR